VPPLPVDGFMEKVAHGPETESSSCVAIFLRVPSSNACGPRLLSSRTVPYPTAVNRVVRLSIRSTRPAAGSCPYWAITTGAPSTKTAKSCGSAALPPTPGKPHSGST
jgi:hypothetical protein